LICALKIYGKDPSPANIFLWKERRQPKAGGDPPVKVSFKDHYGLKEKLFSNRRGYVAEKSS
jgi:hypothetical protein